jgi:PAS domain S-box-containing protein
MIQESLQKSVDLLQGENDLLRAEIVKHLGPAALPTTKPSRVSPDPSNNSMTTTVAGEAESSWVETSTPALASHPLSNTSASLHYNLVKALQTAQQNFTITDPSLPDNPIIYASHGFLALTGYALDQVLGRNCRFLQGAQTDPRAIETMRSGMRSGLDTTTVILNYHYDGTPFWNQLFIGPLKDSNGTVVNYLGVQCKVSERYAEAFFKTPNSSTISVANINTIYSSVMSSSHPHSHASSSVTGTEGEAATEDGHEGDQQTEAKRRLKRSLRDS